MIADRIPQIQQALREAELDGWLFAVFQLNDPISLDLLGLGGAHLVTRRCYYLVPAKGEPRKLVNRLEPAMLDALPGTTAAYTTWQEHRTAVESLVAGTKRLAAQYSPFNQIPTVSRLDAGTADLLRGAGIELALFRRAGAALRRHLDRPAARRPPPRLHRAARAGARGLQDGRRKTAERRRDRRVRGAALPARRLRAPRHLGGVVAHRRRQRAQRRSALSAQGGLVVADPQG